MDKCDDHPDAQAALSAADSLASPGRRHLLRGLGLAGGALGLAVAAAGAATDTAAPNPVADGTLDEQPFYGVHQAGIVNPQPAAALVTSFDITGQTRRDLERLLRTLTTRMSFLMKGGPVAPIDERFPPPDSGLLGAKVFPDDLTITAAVGASLFDERFGLAQVKPRHLVTMQQFPNDALDARRCHGDILLQFCSNTAETNFHALRDIIKHTPGALAPRWTMQGFLPPHTVKKLGKDTVRNFLGFKDGTANLNATDGTLMDRVVWVQHGSDEPVWAAGGAYQVVRIIRMTAERWDRTPLAEQQTIIGREKVSGAPLGRQHEHDDPDYAADPQGKRIPLDAHIRLANPRTRPTDKNLILRRGYNYAGGLTGAGQLDTGLLFICFQADLAAGFLAVQARLNGEPLEEYIKPVGGGYFFALPGVREAGGFLGQGMLDERA